MNQAELPAEVTCTLGQEDLAAQAGRWEQLFRRAVIRRVLTDDGVRLVFRGEAEVESELESLVAVERECCAWAHWSVARDAAELVLSVSSTGDGVGVLQAMFPPDE